MNRLNENKKNQAKVNDNIEELVKSIFKKGKENFNSIEKINQVTPKVLEKDTSMQNLSSRILFLIQTRDGKWLTQAVIPF